MQKIGKRFPGVVALDAVDFSISQGEVVALAGENGAGKSTLMKILGGVYQPDGGRIFIGGKETSIRSVTDASASGIGLGLVVITGGIDLSVASDNCQRLARWNWVGYSRQYSSVSSTWSATDNLHGLPDFFCTRRNSVRTNSQISAKVSGLTPQYRLKNSGESDLICSKLIRLLMSENAFIVK